MTAAKEMRHWNPEAHIGDDSGAPRAAAGAAGRQRAAAGAAGRHAPRPGQRGASAPRPGSGAP
eukprot:jgi/Tetstr1/462965/TSEL_007913.t1